MRVERRIGRIDRIGQEASALKILNLYMEGIIEEDTYDTLKRRIGLFEKVVGPLQPILAETSRIFRRLTRGEIELEEARRLLDEAARKKSRVAIAALEECVRQDLGDAIHGTVGPCPGQAGAARCLVPGRSGDRNADSLCSRAWHDLIQPEWHSGMSGDHLHLCATAAGH
jgi:hypothetical protein